MIFTDNIKSSLKQIKHRLQDNSVESIIWLVNFGPTLAGFSILKDTISGKFFIAFQILIAEEVSYVGYIRSAVLKNVFDVNTSLNLLTYGGNPKNLVITKSEDTVWIQFNPPYWILHFSLLLYVYGVGTIVYQLQIADSTSDFIKSYVNITLIILIFNNSYWFLMERPVLRKVLIQVSKNDSISKETDFLQDKHKKLVSVIKKILFIFYGFNMFNAFFIYIPHRIDVSNDHYSLSSCVGLEPLTDTPNRQICIVILSIQEMTIMTAVLNYQALLLFLIAHTAAMYQLLAQEFLAFDKYEDSPESNDIIKKRLPFLIRRHALTLDTVKNLKALYNMPMGINFGTNAVCICLFFYLTLQEWVTFSPIVIYCLLVFFLYCFLCQNLINASEKFEIAVYSCGWEKFSMKEKKIIYVILLQAQKPVTLLAADIVPVNISTFATALQAMFKFVTVVKF